jgi:radical SAM-linked protein
MTSSQHHPDSRPPVPAAKAAENLRVRYRIRFAKVGLLRWISHRDLARLWERLLRRASLELSMTEGFHPKPRISFPSALALGVEGLDEVVEIELARPLPATDLLDRLRGDDQPGLRIRSVQRLPDRFGKAHLQSADYVISLPDNANLAETADAIGRLMAESTVTVRRKNKDLSVSVPHQIAELSLHDRHLHLTLNASDTASLRPIDVLELLGGSSWIEHGARITRTNVTLQSEFKSTDPDAFAVAESAAACDSSVQPPPDPRPSPSETPGRSSGPNTV